MEKKYKIAHSISQKRDGREQLPMEGVGSAGQGERLQMVIMIAVDRGCRGQPTLPVCDRYHSGQAGQREGIPQESRSCWRQG